MSGHLADQFRAREAIATFHKALDCARDELRAVRVGIADEHAQKEIDRAIDESLPVGSDSQD